ncbi:MAG TPA: DUF2157 domain-containing protein [Symbiobacteriaceae bacterium]|nr:DUF2157 domain-containing protein [Symbiobacteriaceae bacterium]
MAERRTLPSSWSAHLKVESQAWVAGGQITPEQRTAILALYPEEPGAERDRLILILSILGALLVGTGVILFFAANWPRLGSGLKVASILTAVLAAYGSGYYLQFIKGSFPRVGAALLFLGALFYGAGIWLVGQIFHLSGEATGFLLWGLGALPVAWVVRSRPILWLSGLTLTIWTVQAQDSYRSWNLAFPFLLILSVVPLARQLKDRWAEAGALLVTFLWLALNMGHLRVPGDSALLLVAQAAVLYGVGALLEGLSSASGRRSTPAGPYLGVGATLTLFGLYLLTMKLGAEAAPSLFAQGYPGVAAGLILLVAGGAAAWSYWRSGEKGRLLPLISAVALIGATALSPSLSLLPRLIGFNLLLFALEIGLITWGVARRTALLVNIALVGFVVHLITRYFDLFWGAIDRSLFFVLGGLLLIGGGFLLERNRRRWTERGGDDRAA